MFSLKNKLIILISLSFVFPLGGIGISGLSNAHTFNSEPEVEGDFTISSESDGLENGVNFFIYFDALPKGLAIEYNTEIKAQPIIAKIENNYSDSQGGKMSSFRVSQYFTLRKNILGLSIPLLAKASLYLGGGINQHNSVIPSIGLMKDIFKDELSDSSNGIDDFDFNWIYGYDDDASTFDFDDVVNGFKDHAVKTTGLHIQAGLQGKLLTLNAFINARYTFINSDEMESFPGFTVGLAYGL